MPAPSFALFVTIFPIWISHLFWVNLPDALSNVSSKSLFSSSASTPRWGFLTSVRSNHLLAHISLYCCSVSLHIGSHLPLRNQRITVRRHLKGSFSEVLVLQVPSSPFQHQLVSKSKWSGLKLGNRGKLMSFFSSKSAIHTWIEERTESKILHEHVNLCLVSMEHRWLSLMIMNPLLCISSPLTVSFRLQCGAIDAKSYINRICRRQLQGL